MPRAPHWLMPTPWPYPPPVKVNADWAPRCRRRGWRRRGREQHRSGRPPTVGQRGAERSRAYLRTRVGDGLEFIGQGVDPVTSGGRIECGWRPTTSATVPRRGGSRPTDRWPAPWPRWVPTSWRCRRSTAVSCGPGSPTRRPSPAARAAWSPTSRRPGRSVRAVAYGNALLVRGRTGRTRVVRLPGAGRGHASRCSRRSWCATSRSRRCRPTSRTVGPALVTTAPGQLDGTARRAVGLAGAVVRDGRPEPACRRRVPRVRRRRADGGPSGADLPRRRPAHRHRLDRDRAASAPGHAEVPDLRTSDHRPIVATFAAPSWRFPSQRRPQLPIRAPIPMTVILRPITVRAPVRGAVPAGLRRAGGRAARRSGRRRPVDGRLAVVTGATGLLGAAIAAELSRRGAMVCLMGRDLDELRATVDRLGPGARTAILQCDLALSEDVVSAVDFVERLDRPVDLVVHAAGLAAPARIADGPVEQLDEHYLLNVRGPYLLSQRLLPLLRDGSAQCVFVAAADRPGEQAGDAHHVITTAAGRALAAELRVEAARRAHPCRDGGGRRRAGCRTRRGRCRPLRRLARDQRRRVPVEPRPGCHRGEGPRGGTSRAQ